MMMVVTTANAFYFLLFWEMMTVVSYFLVTFESENRQAVQAGYVYMLIAHAGGALIMIAFLIFFINTGSFDFAEFRQAQLPPGLRNMVFILALIGFGSKAGAMPLHFWLPPAHSSAPSHASALMSGIYDKNGHLRDFASLYRSSKPIYLVVGADRAAHRRDIRCIWGAFCAGGKGYQAATSILQRGKYWDYFNGDWKRNDRSGRKIACCYDAGLFGGSLSYCQPFHFQITALPRSRLSSLQHPYTRPESHGRLWAEKCHGPV